MKAELLRVLKGAILVSFVFLVSCYKPLDTDSDIIVSIRDQKMLLSQKGAPVKLYPISTSKYGEGSQKGSMKTPLGLMSVAKKIGAGSPPGTVFKSRKKTGEVIEPNAPGRDPIVTRILWLKGHERHNLNTFSRYIYIHGTPEERNIGKRVSYGCIRMTSEDIIDFYQRVGVGAKIRIIRSRLRATYAGRAYYAALELKKQQQQAALELAQRLEMEKENELKEANQGEE